MSTDPSLKPPVQVRKEYTEAAKLLSELHRTDIPSVPESYFKSRIVPILATPAKKEVDLTFWADIAGHPMRAIRVVDDVTGEELFVAPALMRTLNSSDSDGVSLNQVIHESKLRIDNHPGAGEAYLAQQLSKVRHGSTLYDIESAKTWNAIRVRYGFPALDIGSAGKLIGSLDGSRKTTVATSSDAPKGSIDLNVDDDSFF